MFGRLCRISSEATTCEKYECKAEGWVRKAKAEEITGNDDATCFQDPNKARDCESIRHSSDALNRLKTVVDTFAKYLFQMKLSAMWV